MKNKNHLVQMEMLVMVLVFVLAAAVCLQVFVFAHQLSEQDCARDRAVLEAQSAAETLKGVGGDFKRAAELMGGFGEEGGWFISYDENFRQSQRQVSYCLKAVPKESGQALLGMAEIRVETVAGECLMNLECAWQEGEGHD